MDQLADIFGEAKLEANPAPADPAPAIPAPAETPIAAFPRGWDSYQDVSTAIDKPKYKQYFLVCIGAEN
eukprot:g70864.t1